MQAKTWVLLAGMWWVALGCGDDDAIVDAAADADRDGSGGFDGALDGAHDANATTDSAADALDGGDGGALCPADPFAAIDQACAVEGLTCGGPCSDPCQFCQLIRCAGGFWEGIEAFPSNCFRCGDTLECVADSQYCEIGRSDVGGAPDSFECLPAPDTCGPMVSCACLTDLSYDRCQDTIEGQVTAERFGG